MNGLRFLVSYFSILLVAFSVNAYPSDIEEMKLKLGKHSLSIPENNIIDSNVPFWLSLVPGLSPSTGEILLLIEAEDIASRVEGYQAYDGKLKTDVHLRIEVLDEAALKQILDPQMQVYSDVWFARGLFNDRMVERHEASGFYKVYKKGIKNFWTVVKIFPDIAQPMPDDPFSFWVASCTEGESPMTQTGHVTTCGTKLIFDDLLLDFSVSGINLHVIDDVKTMLTRQLLLWKNQQ